MIKEERPIFFKTLLIAIFVILLNLGFFAYASIDFSNATGFSIKSTFSNLSKNYNNMLSVNKYFLLLELVALSFILIFAFKRDKRFYFIKEKEANLKIIRTKGLYRTDLDDLYTTLKEKKELTISAIAKLFNISKETVIEWCRILEAGDLAYVDYPSFGDPVLKLKEQLQLKKLPGP